VLGTLALANAHGAVRITAMAVFAASVSAMFGTSALYHCGNWAAAWSEIPTPSMLSVLVTGVSQVSWSKGPHKPAIHR
jgi:predicted membrane channel-forming protein YqfA (hemolysin III family)